LAAPASEPQRFGKYQIVERIASGGMAEIFKARLDGIGGFHRIFAIKRILPHLTSNPEFVDMLVDEAKVAGLLSHANIVQILDLGSIDQQYYIAMEFVNGRDLGQLLARCVDKGITLPVPHAVYVLLEMLKGLEYAHNRQVMRGGRPVPLNIVHRDISPANVLVSFQGEVKLTDFGIAKASVKALETMSGVVKGRFDYMSPEQAAGQPVDQRSDLFSAGVLLYEVLTGRHPFRQPGDHATIEAVRRGTYEPPSYVNPDVPYALDLVVEQALKTNPAERFQSATAFKEALDRFFHDAGFIFSASTLAAFIKGLFPESEARPTTRPAAPRPAADAPDDIVLDEESTGRRPAPGDLVPGPDSTLGEVARLLGGLPDAGQSGAFGPVAGLADESTLIRPALALDPKEWADAATALRPDPTAAPAASRPKGAQPGPVNLASGVAPPGDETRPLSPRLASLPPPGAAGRASPPAPRPAPPLAAPAPVADARVSGELRPKVDTRTPRPDSPPRGRTPVFVHLLYLGLALLAAVGGLGIGALAGSLRDGRPEPALVELPPVLEVHYPAGGVVSVNGAPLTGASPATTTLTAGSAARVRVELPDRPPVETTITLGANQHRVLDVSPLDLPKKDP
jgi:serine/threonine protein kinase